MGRKDQLSSMDVPVLGSPRISVFKQFLQNIGSFAQKRNRLIDISPYLPPVALIIVDISRYLWYNDGISDTR